MFAKKWWKWEHFWGGGRELRAPLNPNTFSSFLTSMQKEVFRIWSFIRKNRIPYFSFPRHMYLVDFIFCWDCNLIIHLSGSKEGRQGRAPSGSNYFHFRAVFWGKIDQNNRLALPPLQLASLPLGYPGSAAGHTMCTDFKYDAPWIQFLKCHNYLLILINKISN